MTKFNVGDKVKFNENTPTGWWAKSGQTGTVTKVLPHNLFDVSVDNGKHDWDIYNAPANCLDLVEATGTFIVVKRAGGDFFPTISPRTHTSREQADKFAKEMAGSNGGDFVVFQAVAVASRPVAPVTLTSL
jgi:hypothetical protein